MSFETLKRNRGSNISKIIKAAEATNSGETKSYVDDRVWKPTVDKAGNGYAVVRFLPGAEDSLPFVRYWDHGFKGPTGQWYIENSLTSISQPDPVGELNSRLWNSGIESDKDRARTQKRRLHYVTNVYVVRLIHSICGKVLILNSRSEMLKVIETMTNLNLDLQQRY